MWKALNLAALGLILIHAVRATNASPRLTVDDYMNICLKGKNHKKYPGPESELIYQCSPWKERSCCTAETVAKMHETRRWLNFDWNHCKPLSHRCREHFMQDLCFYECSPNVGPWVVEDVRTIRKERFKNVPLCKSGCSLWWEACKDDMTCVEKWDQHFNWSTGINTCPEGTTCRPFHEVFSDSSHFCESVFGSYSVVPDSPDECFYMWFNANSPNPNEEVARKKASALLGIPYKVKSNDDNMGSALYFTSVVAIILCIPLAFIL